MRVPRLGKGDQSQGAMDHAEPPRALDVSIGTKGRRLKMGAWGRVEPPGMSGTGTEARRGRLKLGTMGLHGAIGGIESGR